MYLLVHPNIWIITIFLCNIKYNITDNVAWFLLYVSMFHDSKNYFVICTIIFLSYLDKYVIIFYDNE